MAVIKQAKLNVRGGTTVATLLINAQDGVARNSANIICSIPDGQDALYFCGKAYDPSTLQQLDQKAASALAANRDIGGNPPVTGNKLSNNLFLTNRAYAYTPRLSSQCPAQSLIPYRIKPEYRLNLDPALRLGAGKLFKFTDQTGVPHMIHTNFVRIFTIGNTQAHRVSRQSLTLIQGDSLDTPNFVSVYPASGALIGQQYNDATSQDFYPIHVDTATRKIFGLLSYSHNNEAVDVASYYDEYSGHPAYIPYTTVGESGTLSLGNLTKLTGWPARISAGTGSNYTGEQGIFFFCGLDNSNRLVFMAVSEQDTSHGNPGGTASNWTNGNNWSKSSNGTRITIYAYDPAADTTTVLLGPLGKATGWSANTGTTSISDNYGHHVAPSPFVQSPKAGEETVYYSYMPIVDFVDVMRYLVVRWDKATNAFDIRVNTLAAGFDPNVYYKHPTGRNALSLMCFPSCEVITGASGTKYLMQFTRNFYAADIASGIPNDTLFNAILVMQIDSNDPRNLSFTQSIPNASVMDIIPLETHGRSMLAIHTGEVALYSFDEASFLTKTFNQGGVYFAAGKDVYGNIWAVSSDEQNLISPSIGAPAFSTGSNLEFFVPMRLELITQSLTSRVTCVFEDATINYAGVNLSKNLVINAFNAAGQRIATSVVVKLTSDVATFTANGLKTLTVSTNAAANTLVNLTITGAGSINASASFTV